MKYDKPSVTLMVPALQAVKGTKGGPDLDGITVTPFAYEADE